MEGQMIRAIAASALVAMLGLMPAQAQVMADPDVVASFLETYGLKVTHDTDDAGDPMLSSRIEGTYFDVFFYGCTNGKGCTSIEFSAKFETKGEVKLYTINEWNKNGRFARAYLGDDGSANVEYDVNLDFDGVGGKNFDDTIDVWRTVLEDFRKQINW